MDLKSPSPNPSSRIELEYLFGLLEDEFREESSVRLRRVTPSSTQRSPDLDQDYDPNSNDLHLREGVMVRAHSREFFFPLYWVRDKRFNEVQALILEVRAWI